MPTLKLQVRRDTAINWTAANPQLLPGEIGFETDTGKLKIGREIGDYWNTVDYLNAFSDHTHPITDLTTTGTANASTFLSGTGVWTELGISHIADLQTDLNDKADAVHTHTEYAATSHTHTAANITDFATSVQSEITLSLAANKTIAGTWTFINPQFKLSELGSVSGAVALTLANACFFKATITGATTLSISGTLTGSNTVNLGLVLVNPGTNITWPTSFKWSGATTPTLTTTGTDILTFISYDNGTTWLNVGQSLDVK